MENRFLPLFGDFRSKNCTGEDDKSATELIIWGKQSATEIIAPKTADFKRSRLLIGCLIRSLAGHVFDLLDLGVLFWYMCCFQDCPIGGHVCAVRINTPTSIHNANKLTAVFGHRVVLFYAVHITKISFSFHFIRPKIPSYQVQDTFQSCLVIDSNLPLG